MGFPNGDIKISNNFELNAAKALDARTTVANLTERDAIDFKYAGLIVYVGAVNKPYVCTNPAGAGTWAELGGGDFIPRTGTLAGFPVNGNFDVANLYVLNATNQLDNYFASLTIESQEFTSYIYLKSSFDALAINFSSLLVATYGVFINAPTSILFTLDTSGAYQMTAQALNIKAGRSLYFQNPLETFGTSLKAGANTTDVTLTLPTSTGTAGQAMVTDGAGNLSFATVGGGGDFIPRTGTVVGFPIGGGFEISNYVAFIKGATSLSVSETNISSTINAPNGAGGTITLQTYSYNSFAATIRAYASDLSQYIQLQINEVNICQIKSTGLEINGGKLLSFYNTANTQSVALKSGNLSASYTLTLPTSTGTAGQAIITDGAGNLSFATVGGGGAPALTSQRIAFGSPTNTIAESADFTWDDTTKTLFLNQGNIRSDQGIFKITINGLESAMRIDRDGANTSVGYKAHETGLGSNNVAVGSEALTSVTSGSNNVAVGNGALYSATSASNNVAIGVSALFSNNGGRNIAIGGNSLRNNTTGDFNTAIGFGSLENNLTGDSNLAIGYNTLRSAASGFSNVAIGESCLLTFINGSDNISIGVAVLAALQNGNGNLAIGANSGFNLVNGSFNILLGRFCQASSATAANEMNIGGYANDAFISVINIGNGGVNDSGLPGTSVVFKTSNSFGSNIASGSLTIAAGQSTGNALGGGLYFQTCTTGASGTTVNGLQTRVSIDSVGIKIGLSADKVGFFNVAPVLQQTGGDFAAAATYTTNTQSMINTMYTALKNYGLLAVLGG